MDIFLWIRRNYKNIVFIISIICCYLFLFTEQSFFLGFLFLSLVIQLIILLQIIYEVFIKNQIQENLPYLVKFACSLFFTIYFIIEAISNYRINSNLLFAVSAVLCLLSGLVQKKTSQSDDNPEIK